MKMHFFFFRKLALTKQNAELDALEARLARAEALLAEKSKHASPSSSPAPSSNYKSPPRKRNPLPTFDSPSSSSTSSDTLRKEPTIEEDGDETSTLQQAPEPPKKDDPVAHTPRALLGSIRMNEAMVEKEMRNPGKPMVIHIHETVPEEPLYTNSFEKAGDENKENHGTKVYMESKVVTLKTNLHDNKPLPPIHDADPFHYEKVAPVPILFGPTHSTPSWDTMLPHSQDPFVDPSFPGPTKLPTHKTHATALKMPEVTTSIHSNNSLDNNSASTNSITRDEDNDQTSSPKISNLNMRLENLSKDFGERGRGGLLKMKKSFTGLRKKSTSSSPVTTDLPTELSQHSFSQDPYLVSRKDGDLPPLPPIPSQSLDNASKVTSSSALLTESRHGSEDSGKKTEMHRKASDTFSKFSGKVARGLRKRSDAQASTSQEPPLAVWEIEQSNAQLTQFSNPLPPPLPPPKNEEKAQPQELVIGQSPQVLSKSIEPQSDTPPETPIKDYDEDVKLPRVPPKDIPSPILTDLGSSVQPASSITLQILTNLNAREVKKASDAPKIESPLTGVPPASPIKATDNVPSSIVVSSEVFAPSVQPVTIHTTPASPLQEPQLAFQGIPPFEDDNFGVDILAPPRLLGDDKRQSGISSGPSETYSFLGDYYFTKQSHHPSSDAHNDDLPHVAPPILPPAPKSIVEPCLSPVSVISPVESEHRRTDDANHFLGFKPSRPIQRDNIKQDFKSQVNTSEQNIQKIGSPYQQKSVQPQLNNLSNSFYQAYTPEVVSIPVTIPQVPRKLMPNANTSNQPLTRPTNEQNNMAMSRASSLQIPPQLSHPPRHSSNNVQSPSMRDIPENGPLISQRPPPPTQYRGPPPSMMSPSGYSTRSGYNSETSSVRSSNGYADNNTQSTTRTSVSSNLRSPNSILVPGKMRSSSEQRGVYSSQDMRYRTASDTGPPRMGPPKVRIMPPMDPGSRGRSPGPGDGPKFNSLSRPRDGPMRVRPEQGDGPPTHPRHHPHSQHGNHQQQMQHPHHAHLPVHPRYRNGPTQHPAPFDPLASATDFFEPPHAPGLRNDLPRRPRSNSTSSQTNSSGQNSPRVEGSRSSSPQPMVRKQNPPRPSSPYRSHPPPTQAHHSHAHGYQRTSSRRTSPEGSVHGSIRGNSRNASDAALEFGLGMDGVMPQQNRRYRPPPQVQIQHGSGIANELVVNRVRASGSGIDLRIPYDSMRTNLAGGGGRMPEMSI